MINKNSTYALKIASLGLLSLTFSNCKRQSAVQEKPNVLFVIFDDLRPELGFNGSKAITPNLDRFGETAVSFNRAYCNIPVCGASRASLLTGIRPAQFTFLHYDSSAEEDAPNAITLPEHFKNNGYYTIARSKVFGFPEDSKDSWHELWSPIDTSFWWRDYLNKENRFLDSIGGRAKGAYPFECADVHDTAYFDGKAVKMAVNDISRLKAKGKPFFLAVGLRKPHLPFNAPKAYWDLYDRSDFELPENYTPVNNSIPGLAYHNWSELRAYYGVPPKGPVADSVAVSLLHGYYACVSYVDQLFGNLLDALKKEGLDKNTIIVVLGDHGFTLGEHGLWCKHSNFNTSLHSLLMAYVPGMSQAGITNSITEFVDIYPTICDLCNLEYPDHLEGVSFKNVLLNPLESNKNYAVSRWGQGITYIKDNYFFTQWRNEKDSVYMGMLFNHSDDPDENHNIYQNEDIGEMIQLLEVELIHKRGNWLGELPE
jgi:iduronate 2-sulfatase